MPVTNQLPSTASPNNYPYAGWFAHLHTSSASVKQVITVIDDEMILSFLVDNDALQDGPPSETEMKTMLNLAEKFGVCFL